MSTSKKPLGQAAFSLVEIIVVIAILGIAAALGSSYFSKNQNMAATEAARAQAIDLNQRLLKLWKRDLAYAQAPENVTIVSKHEMRIKRTRLISGSQRPDSTKTYEVSYRAVCSPIPPQINAFFGPLTFQLTPDMKKRSACQVKADLKCKTGTFPQLLITAPKEAGVPSYPETAFPNPSAQPTNASRIPIASIPCFTKVGAQIEVAIDTFTATKQEEAATALHIVGEKFFLLTGNVSDMLILQK